MTPTILRLPCLIPTAARRCELPDPSFFLFGPCGTGKTTWLKHVLPDAPWFDLLRTQVVPALIRQPESFRQQVEALPRGRWVVIDAVQPCCGGGRIGVPS